MDAFLFHCYNIKAHGLYGLSIYWQKIIVSLFTTFNKPQYSTVLYLLSIYEDKKPDDEKEEDNNKSTSALRALDDHQKFHFDYTAPAAISVQLTVVVADKRRDMYHL